MKKLLWAICLCLLVMLAGCTKTQEETLPATYTVRFVMKGNICSEQIVTEGQLPEAVSHDVPGLRFVQWCNAEGQAVDPYTVPVYQDTRYEALAYPQLTGHGPYLFTDEEGYLRPDDVLTGHELLRAMQALAAEGAENYFPGMPAGTQSVTGETLTKVLESFFDTEAVAAAFADTVDTELTRTAFAQGMQQLLGREDTEKLILEADVQIPKDVTRERTDTVALLEAALPHTPGAGETVWTDLELPERYPQGFVNIDGWLYYVQENYRFLKDGYVGVLYFDENGRYTCGDAELDQMVADILKDLIAQDPEADKLTLLKTVFDHCHENYKYLRRNAYSFGQTGWEIDDAKVMFEKGRGNCYNFAAIFWALSRGLGYETRAVSGTCTGTDQPHGWCIIEIDGADYFFDPEWQYAYREENRPAKDMFMIPMSKISYWTYKWTE